MIIHNKTCAKPSTRKDRWICHCLQLTHRGLDHHILLDALTKKGWWVQLTLKLGNNICSIYIYIYTLQVNSMLKIKVDTLQTSRDAILEPHCCEMMVDKAEYQGNNWAWETIFGIPWWTRPPWDCLAPRGRSKSCSSADSGASRLG